MKVTVYIHPNDRLYVEVPDDTEKTLGDEHPQLSAEERKALLAELAAKFTEFVGPDFPPLSDYATSREGIYEGHPKL